MSERQLRSKSTTTGVEIESRNAESNSEIRELDLSVTESVSAGGRKQDEILISNEEKQSPDNQINNPENSDDNTSMFTKQLDKFMETVMMGFENLQSRIQSDNDKLVEKLNNKIESESSRLVQEIESNNKRLSERLTKQFREANEKLRAELSSKIEGEATKFQKDIDKLRSDTTIEILSVSHSVEGACDKLEDRLTKHIEETGRRIDRVTEELKAKTKVLEMGCSRQTENTDSEIQSLRQELIQTREQHDADMSAKISVCNSQILAEKQDSQASFLKVNQEIDKLKERLAVNMTGDETINATNNDSTVTSIVSRNQEGTVPVVSNNDQISDHTSRNSKACENVCKCNNTVLNEVNGVKVADSPIHVNRELMANCSSLNELTLPIYSDHTAQVIGNFLKDLEIYFDLKGVPENLKLPLAARAVQDPFTKAWLSAEYYKLGSFEKFKTQVTQLLWNDQRQSNIRCKIFQDKYEGSGEETLAAHYVKYVNLAANLHPPLSEYDLIGALTAHYPYEVQKCMISANLKSNQEALTLLGKLQAIGEESRAHKENNLEAKQRDFRKRENRNTGYNREENRREYNQTVRHVTCDRRQGQHSRPQYNRHARQRYTDQSYNGRTEGSPTNRRQLNPQVSEFHPTTGSYRLDPKSEPVNRTDNESQLLEN